MALNYVPGMTLAQWQDMIDAHAASGDKVVYARTAHKAAPRLVPGKKRTVTKPEPCQHPFDASGMSLTATRQAKTADLVITSKYLCRCGEELAKVEKKVRG